MSPTPASQPFNSRRAPGPVERRLFTVLPFVYAGLLLSVLPFATLPGVENPHVAAMSAGGVLFADICTTLLLAAEYRRGGQRALLYLTCAYVYSGVMALLHVLTFPGAIVPGPLMGNFQTVSWLFALWRAGHAVLLVLALATAGRPLPDAAPERGRMLVEAVALACAAAVSLGAVFINASFPSTVGNTFTGLSLQMNWASVGVYLLGLALIWRQRAFNDVLYLWLALVLMASAADLALTTASGARYTLGWYIGRASWVISACVLLLFWLTHESSAQVPSRLRTVTAYGSALCILTAAMLLQWFLMPWLGRGFPFATAFASVAIAVWLGGWRPALVTAAAGYFVADTWFMEPDGPHAPARQLLGLLLYMLTCSVIAGLGEAMRRARDNYRASEQRFRRSQEASLQGYALLHALRDADGRVVDFRIDYVNPHGAAIVRRGVAELTGESLTAALPGVRAMGVFDALVRVVETRRPIDAETRYEADGIDGWFRNLVVPVDDGVAFSFSDVTETRRLAAELEARAAELQQADTNKSRFLAVLSHELRNPMAPLRNALALLARSSEKHTISAVLPIMDRQLTHLTRLIDDLLDVSRIDRGKLELRQERLALETIVRSAIETARPNLEAKSHELVVRYPPAPIYVEGDLVRLTQVVANLLNNAAKFTPQRGHIEIGMSAAAGAALVEVSDNGIGIARDELTRIFDMFVQVDSARAVGAGGLGLGLTLARAIARRHEGRLEAHSDGPGKGSRFLLRLPAAPAPFPERRLEAVATRAPGSSRILIVDDNEDAATTLADLLRLEGHEVRVAFNGMDALQLARAFGPAIAFIDLNMPGIDGLELAARLRADVATRHVRLVAVTGMGQQADVARTRAAGFSAHLTKPAPIEEVLRLASAGHPGHAPRGAGAGGDRRIK